MNKNCLWNVWSIQLAYASIMPISSTKNYIGDPTKRKNDIICVYTFIYERVGIRYIMLRNTTVINIHKAERYHAIKWAIRNYVILSLINILTLWQS